MPKFGSGAGSHKVTTDIHAGLKNRSPKWPDASTKVKGAGSVSNDTTRSTVAKSPKSLGPRTA